MTASISIITVTLNADQVLPRLLASLRAQSDKAFDFVVIDGDSTDSTWQLVQAASDIVTFCLKEPDCGLYDALNKAVRRVQTEFYVVLGSDDTLHPDAISNYKQTARQTGADVVIAGVIEGNKLRMGFHRHRAWLGHSAMVTSHSVGMMIRTGLHARCGEYPLRYPVLADGYIIKKLCTDPTVKTVAGNFVAGEFSAFGISHRSLIRALCETWQIQIDTGEHPVLQYVIFQCRLIKNLFKITRR